MNSGIAGGLDLPTPDRANGSFMDDVRRDIVKLAATAGLTLAPAEPVEGELNAKSEDVRVETAARLLRAGQLRKEVFGSKLINDPAWQILLNLYVSARAGRSVTVTSASEASGAPLSTGLRTVTSLLDSGQIVREVDSSDRRRSLLMLAPETEGVMGLLFDRL